MSDLLDALLLYLMPLAVVAVASSIADTLLW